MQTICLNLLTPLAAASGAGGQRVPMLEHEPAVCLAVENYDADCGHRLQPDWREIIRGIGRRVRWQAVAHVGAPFAGGQQSGARRKPRQPAAGRWPVAWRAARSI